MISIYLFTKKSQFILSILFVFNFQKSYLHLLYQKNLLQNFLFLKITFNLIFIKEKQFILKNTFFGQFFKN